MLHSAKPRFLIDNLFLFNYNIISNGRTGKERCVVYGISNEIKGKVAFIREGAVNCSLGIELPTGDIIIASITVSSLQKLGLKVGDTAYACVKATDVIVAID